MHGVGDVQQDSVTRTGARRQTRCRIDGDVVAPPVDRGRLRAFTMVAALPQTVHVSGLGSAKMRGLATILAVPGAPAEL